jgi:hypothetical protein
LQLHLWQHHRYVAIVHFATRTSVVKKPNCNVALRCNKKTLATTRWTTTQYPNATRPFASHCPRNNLVAIVSIATKYGILQHILCVALGGKSSSVNYPPFPWLTICHQQLGRVLQQLDKAPQVLKSG